MHASSFTAPFSEQLSTPAVGAFRPWPDPTPAEIVESPAYQAADSSPGAIGWALGQPDGTVADLKGEVVTAISQDGRTVALREVIEPESDKPRLVVCLPKGIAELAVWHQIDILGGTLTTLPDGQRAIADPKTIALWVSQNGFPALFVPKSPDDPTQLIAMPWRKVIYGQ